MSELTIVGEYTDQLNLFDGDMFTDGYSIPGFSEVEKAWMVGVPHLITCVTFWVPKKGIGHCSVEAYVGTSGMLERALRRNKIPGSALGTDGKPIVEAQEAVVYSDGSTGVRRQLVRMFQTFGLIDVGHESMPEEGKLGESRFDTPWIDTSAKPKKDAGWKSFTGTRMQGEVTVPSIQKNHLGNPLRIKVVNGLQDSDYENEYGNGTTYYLR